MKRFLFPLLMTTQAVFGQSQDSTAVTELPEKTDFRFSLISELSLTFAFGYGNLSNYRAFLEANQVQTAFRPEPFIDFGFGGRYNRFKLMGRVGLNALPTPAASEPGSGSLVARQNKAGYLEAMLGFDVINARNRRLYLNAGVGNIGYEFSIYRQTSQTVAFQNLLQQTSVGSVPSLSVINTYWNVNVEYCQREKRRRGASSVIRIGYRRGIRPQPWTSDAYQLTNPLTDRISQAYVQIGYYFASNYAKRGKP